MNKQLNVCEVCSAMLVVDDAESRSDRWRKTAIEKQPCVCVCVRVCVRVCVCVFTL